MKEGVILYIGGFELPDKNAAAHRVLSNAKIFRELGRKVVFVGVDKKLAPNSNVENTRKETQEFETYAVPYPGGIKQWVRYFSNIKPYVKICETLGDVAAVVCYNFPSIALQKMISYCHEHGMECHADITEWYSVVGRSLPVKIMKGFDTWLRMRVVHKRMDGLIVISRYLENYYKGCKNVVYIPTLTDASEEKWQGTVSKSDIVLKLVYAGNPGRKDRIDTLIEALQFVNREFLLDVIGITKEQYLEMYPKHRYYLERNKSIAFHGRLDHLTTLGYVKAANYSCFFRDDDRVTNAGFPTKFAEAITCGTPIISNKSSNISDYLKDGKNGILIDNMMISDVAKVISEACGSLEVQNYLFDYWQFTDEMRKLM